MSNFGALDLPLPTDDTPVGDPCLTTLLAFLKAAINRQATAAWNAVGTAKDPVSTTWTHDPRKAVFSEAHLPALYLFRTRARTETIWLTDADVVSEDELELLWVMPPAAQEQQRKRLPFAQAIGKIAASALLTARDPAWKVSGDPDVAATDLGSYVRTFAGVRRLLLGRHEAFVLDIPTDSEVRKYDALRLPIDIQERFVPPPGTHPLKSTNTFQTLDDPPYANAVAKFPTT